MIEIVKQAHAWTWERVKWASDQELFGLKQCMVPPEETLRLGQGDCEDFASVVRHRAVALGVPPEDLRIDLCLVRQVEQHAVLSYRQGELICDCLLQEPRSKARRYDLSDFRAWM